MAISPSSPSHANAPLVHLLRRLAILLVAIAGLFLLIHLALRREAAPAPSAEFVGSAVCATCHDTQFKAWRGSDHDLAMDVASDSTVLGDFGDATFNHQGTTSRFYRRDGKFLVFTEGPDGVPAEFEITHTFGHDPLQQYLVPFPEGRWQALSIVWDREKERWFHLYPDSVIAPDDWLHWTRGGQNWNAMCAECHSTNLQKKYDAETRTYSTSWSEIDVACEACHGPGSKHRDWARRSVWSRLGTRDKGLEVPTSAMDSRQLVETCAPCHARRSELADYTHNGGPLMDELVPTLLHEGLYHADGQIQDEVYVYGSFLQSKMYHHGVSCRDCHDSHSLALRHEGNALCLPCHKPEDFNTVQHHHHPDLPDGRPNPGSSCVGCHMMEQSYMGIDWRADHSFRIPRPDLSAVTGAPNSCSSVGCHDDRSLIWVVEAHQGWYGTEPRPHFGTDFAAARLGRAEAGPRLARLVGNAAQPTIVRATALELLSRLPGGVPDSLLIRGLKDPDPLLRHAAAARLTTDDPALRARRLAPLLSDPIRAVRLTAAYQLAGIPRALLSGSESLALEEAVAEYEVAMTHSLDFAFAGHNLGNLQAALGHEDRAEGYYRQALEIDDHIPEIHTNLGLLLNGQGRNTEAEPHLRRALELDPTGGWSAYHLGLLLGEMGRYEESARHLARASELMPHHKGARRNLAEILRFLDREPSGP